MVTYDDTAGVYEAWADDEARVWIGAFDTRAEAERAAREWTARAACARLRDSEHLCDCQDYGPGGLQPCRAAIAKAEG